MKPTRTALAAATLAVGLLLAGCTDSDDPDREDVGEADCQMRLRIAGVVYDGVGYVEDREAAVTSAGQGEISSCDDEGTDPQGAYFPPSPETVPVFTFAGQDADRVVATDFPSGYAVYVVGNVPASEQQALLESVQAGALGVRKAKPRHEPVGNTYIRTFDYELLTHCGIRWAKFEGNWWLTSEYLADRYAIHPPEGWDDPIERGRMRLLSDDRAIFISEGHQPLSFRATDKRPQSLCD